MLWHTGVCGIPCWFEIHLRKIKGSKSEIYSCKLPFGFHGVCAIQIDYGRKLALAEIKEMFELLKESPQLHYAFAWTPCCRCANMNAEMFCTERVCDDDGFLWLLELPERDYIYVLEFISPGSNGDEYPWSYLRFLLHIMSLKLRSFEVASGQELETNLIHQAIRFGNRSGHEVDPMANVDEREQCIFSQTLTEGIKEMGVKRVCVLAMTIWNHILERDLKMQRIR